MGKKIAKYLPALLAALAAFAVYLPALRNDFVNWDDDVYVYDNPHIRILDWRLLKWAFSSFHASNWHPLTWISHALDYAVWGLNPLGHHLTNSILHALNTFIVVVLCVRLLEAGRSGGRTGAFPDAKGISVAAGVTGLLFGLHPLHVESVAWVSERKDLLCGLFFLLSIAAYLQAVVSPGEARSRPDRLSLKECLNRYYLLSLALFALALASKPMAVSLPAVLVLLDWYPLERLGSRKALKYSLVEKIPFLALSVLVSILTVIAQSESEAVVPLETLPLTARVATAFMGMMMYLVKMALPVGLAPLYPYPKSIVLFSLEYISALAVVCAITVVCVLMLKRQRIVMAVWIYFTVTLLPVLGFLQTGSQSMADRYTYLPSVGPFLLAGLASAWGWEKTCSLKQWGRPVRAGMISLAVAVPVSLSLLTVELEQVWKNGIDLGTYMIGKYPGRVVPEAHIIRGIAFREKGELSKAVEDFDAVIDHGHAPQSSYLAYNYRAATLTEMGLMDRAIEDLNRATSLDPSRHLSYCNRGLVLIKMRRYPQAVEEFNTAIALNPSGDSAFVGRGLAFSETGRLERALDDLDKALMLNPYNGDAYVDRGLTFERMGQRERALSDYSAAVALTPSDYQAYGNRGLILEAMGRLDAAIEDYSRMIVLRPDSSEAYRARGGAYLKAGNREFALRDFQSACDLGDGEGCRIVRESLLPGR